MEQTYGSKIDGWILVTLGMAFLFPPLVVTVVAIITHQYFILPLGLIGPVLIAVLAIPIRYQLTDQALIVRAGVIRMRVPYDKITRVEPSRSLFSAPALSLDRLRITYGHAVTMVSPDDRYNFLADLKRLAGLKGDGDVLTR